MPKRILLVDDEVHILRAAEFKFQRLGHEVQCAYDGEEAWSMIEERKPHLIVTDCQMPRLDGLGLAARVAGHAETMDIPIIMLSAKGFELSASEIREQFGIVALLAKPFSPRELVTLAERTLAERSPATADSA
jgi:two-component system, OmpR family, alkaline phosphatase synthesis response regulator PhoP